MSDPMHLQHPVDCYPWCWPASGRSVLMTTDPKEVTCEACKEESYWRPIPGFMNYEVNELGEVRNFNTMDRCKIHISARNAVQVKLYNAATKKSTSRSIRALVREVFGVTLSTEELKERFGAAVYSEHPDYNQKWAINE